MKKFKILFLLAGDQRFASSRVRGHWISEELENENNRCSIIICKGRDAFFSAMAAIAVHEVIIFQKIFFRWHLILINVANMLGKITIFDLDDLPDKSLEKNASKMIKSSSAVFAGSENLLNYINALNRNGFFVPTSIKIANYNRPVQKSDNDSICIGWIGNGQDYAEDIIKILEKPLKEVAFKFSVRFKVVGASGQKKLYDVFSHIPSIKFEPVDQIQWENAQAVSDQLADFDIGLYPLRDNEFNRHKCGFKALEYMAMGIPVVASPVGEITRIIDHGKEGFFATSQEEWVRYMSYLISEDRNRIEMGCHGRAKIMNKYNSKKIAGNIYCILQDMKFRSI